MLLSKIVCFPFWHIRTGYIYIIGAARRTRRKVGNEAQWLWLLLMLIEDDAAVESAERKTDKSWRYPTRLGPWIKRGHKKTENTTPLIKIWSDFTNGQEDWSGPTICYDMIPRLWTRGKDTPAVHSLVVSFAWSLNLGVTVVFDRNSLWPL